MAQPCKILIVDDDPTMCSVLTMALSPLGHEIISANDGRQAIEKLRANQCSVVILDLALPGPDGIEILKRIRNQQFDAEVVMLTAHASLETAIEALRLGAYDYVTKPAEIDIIRSTVRKAIEKQRLESRLTAISDLSREMALMLDVEQVAEVVLEIVERVLEFEACYLLLVAEEQDELYPLAVYEQEAGPGAAGGQGEAKIKEGSAALPLENERAVAAQVARSGEPLYVSDLQEDLEHLGMRDATRSALAVPLKVKDRVIGVLNVESAKSDGFGSDDVELLSTLAAQASVAIENARLYHTVKTNSEYYQAVTDGLHDQVLIVDRDYRITDVNAAFLRQTNRTRQEVIGQLCYELVQQHDEPCGSPDHACPAWEVWETGQPLRFTQVRYDQDGIAHWLDVTASPLRDADGQVTQVIEAHRDMTAERQLEERLAGVHTLGQELVLSRSQQQVAQVAVDAAIFLLQGQLCGLWLLEPKEETLIFQAQAGSVQSTDQYTLLPEDEGSIIAAVARTAEPLYVPDVQSRAREGQPHMGMGTEQGNQTVFCVPLKLQDKLIGVLNAESHRPDAFDEAARRLLAVLADYSALALENARLYEETARRLAETRGLQEMMLAAASTLDLDQVLIRAIQTIHRVQRVEYVSLNLPDESGEYLVIHPSHVGFAAPPEDLRISLHGDSMPSQAYNDGTPKLINDVPQTPAYFQGRLDLCSELAVPVWVGEQVIAVLHAGSPHPNAFDQNDLQFFKAIGAQLGVVIRNAQLYQAEREQRKLVERSQAQLVQSEKLAATGRLAASLAHEINNPLQAIRNSLQLVLNFPLNPSEQQEYLQMANEEVERLTDVSSRILDFARRPQREMKPMDLNAILEKTLALTRKYLQHRRVMLERDLAPELPTAMASPGELEQVFLNLVLNALDAMPNGGTLRVSSYLNQNGHLAVVFADDGQGIPPEHLDRIFEPFFSTKKEGTGLGLSVSYNVVKKHKGELLVESAVGEGTTFTVLLPVLTG